jgi:thimet oligopeptidase
MVLEPGGSQDANVLIENFLGRPLSLDAFKTELQTR